MFEARKKFIFVSLFYIYSERERGREREEEGKKEKERERGVGTVEDTTMNSHEKIEHTSATLREAT